MNQSSQDFLREPSMGILRLVPQPPKRVLIISCKYKIYINFGSIDNYWDDHNNLSNVPIGLRLKKTWGKKILKKRRKEILGHESIVSTILEEPHQHHVASHIHTKLTALAPNKAKEKKENYHYTPSQETHPTVQSYEPKGKIWKNARPMAINKGKKGKTERNDQKAIPPFTWLCVWRWR